VAETQNSKQNVQAPETGQTVIVNAIPGQDIVLEAAFDQAEVKMDGGNVVFEFANGGQVVLDFTDLGEAQAPNVVMPDGTVLDMQEFLAALGEKDVEPAAGPEAGTADSGGVGDYQDDPGSTILGLDMLDGFGPNAFSSTSVDALEANGSIPILLGPDGVLVEDEALFPEGNNEDDGGVGFVTGTIVDNVDWGADGFGEVTGFNVGGASFSAGSTVFWGQDGSFLGTSGEGAAASLVVGADGFYTFTSLDNMLLGEGVQGEQINVLGTVQIVGVDTTGDEVEIPLTLSVQDDVPEIIAEMNFDTAIVEDEKMQGLLGRLFTDERDGLRGYFEGTIEDNVKWGADEFRGVTEFSIGEQVFTVEAGESTTVYWDQHGKLLSLGDEPSNGPEMSFASFGKGYDGEFQPAASLEVKSDGTYIFRLHDNMLLGEGEKGEQIDDLATVMITGLDNDGDAVQVGVNLQVQDDVPSCWITPDYAIVEDEKMEGGNDEPGRWFPAQVDGTIVDNAVWGADGFGQATTFEIDGYLFEVGTTVFWDQHGNLILPEGVGAGDQGSFGASFLEVSVNPEGAAASLVVNANGTYTFKLIDNMLLGRGQRGEQINLLDKVTVKAEDADGDQVDVTVYLKVQDDVPVASGESVSAMVDEDDIDTRYSEGNFPEDGNEDGSFTGNPWHANDGPANVSGTVSGLVLFGADGGSFSLSNDFQALITQELSSKGVDLQYFLDSAGDTLIAKAGSRTVFTLDLKSNGDYKFSLYDQLDHSTGAGENNLPINLSSALVATDGDGDILRLSNGFTINVTDDAPIQVKSPAVYRIVEEESLDGGNKEGFDLPTVVKGSLASQVSFGADEKGTFSLGETTGLQALGLKSGGEDLEYTISENNSLLTASADGHEVFTLKLYQNGKFTFTLEGPLDHAKGHGENVLELNLSSVIKATDFDGDSITLDNDFYVQVIDDVPTVTWNNTVRLDDDALSEGNPGGVNDGPDSVNADGTLGHSFGADGGSISWLTTGNPRGFRYASGDDNTLLITQNGTLVLTLTLNPDTGAYTVTQNAPIMHERGNFENNQIFNIEYQVKDGDGDTVRGSLSINVDDDSPIARNDEDDVVRVDSDSGISRVAEGNVLTGEDTVSGDDGQDASGADQPAVVALVGFDTNGDGSVQPSERVAVSDTEVSITGNYGTLTIQSDGSYRYVADPDSLPGPTTVNTGEGMTVNAFRLGESFFDADGKYNSVAGTGLVTTGGNSSAQGVDSGLADDTISVPEQINYSGSLSEALAFEFDGPVSSATIKVSNLFNDERGGEAARWHAFDASGVRIATGIISNNGQASVYEGTTNVTWDPNNADNVGTFTVSGVGTFATLVIEALPYSNNGNVAGDDSDFFATVVSYDALPAEGTEYSDVFKYWIKDADGDYSSATLTINGIEPNPEGDFVNQAPVAADNNYTLESSSISGNIITDDDNDAGAASGRDWDADTPVANLSVHSISWEGGSQTLALGGTQQVVSLQYGTLTINPDGSYTYALNEDASGETDSFTYTLEDVHGELSGSADVIFTIPDSAPTAYDNYAVAEEGSVSPVNLVVVLDTSGSMFQSGSGGIIDLPGGEQTTRLALAKDALDNLYETYGDNLQNVMFVTFDTAATIWTATNNGAGWDFSGTSVAVNGLDSDGAEWLTAGSFWMSPEAASAALDSSELESTIGGQTDYENALGAVVGGLDGTSSPGGLPTYVYFLSDGNPTQGAINPTEQGHWGDFINQLPLNIQEVYAVGIGDNIGTDALGTVASDLDNVITVDDATELPAVLESTVDIQSGNVITESSVDGTDDSGSDGWGSPVLLSVEYGSNVFTFSTVVTERSIDTAAGNVVIRSDGSYDFTPLADVKDDVSDMIKYTVQDGDGSTANAYLHLTTTDASEVMAVDDLDSARPVPLVTTDSVSHEVTIPGHVEPVELEIDNFAVDPSPLYNYGFASNYSESFTTSAPTEVIFDLFVSGFNKNNGDTGSVVLQKLVGTTWSDVPSASYEFPVGVSTVQNIGFAIDEPGTYRLVGRGDDNSWLNGNFKFTVKNIDGTIYESIPPQQTTVNQAFVDVDWAAAALAVGNVVMNDDLGSEGASLVEVNGIDVLAGGTLISGLYGDLTIHPDGDYSYSPSYAPDDADYVGGLLTDSFTYTLEQNDGDSSTAVLTFDVTPDLPTGAIVADSVTHLATGTVGADFLFGTSGDDTLEGSDGNDYINGGAGNDYITGGTGNDHLVGADGNDTLIGGAGDDLMTGGAGSDVFKYMDGDLAGVVYGDTITDFQLGTDGDTLDLSALLNGENSGNLANFLDFEVTNIDSGTGTATVQINVDQNGGGDFATHLATVEVMGVGAADDADAVVTQMITQILIDHP